MPPLTSTAHSHYQKVKINGVTRQRCLRCKVQTYADSTSTTVLLKHWKKCKATAVPASSMSSSTSSSQSLLSSSSASAAALAVNADAPVVTSHRRVYGPLDTAFSTASNLQLRPALAELFAIHTLPHHIIESAAFHAAVDAIRASTERLPNRRQLRAEQDVVAQRLRARVLNKLRNYCRSSPVTVALDGWTNVRRDKVTNVVILCGGAAYYWCSIVNSTASNTAAWMREPVANVINELREEGLIVAGLRRTTRRSIARCTASWSSAFPSSSVRRAPRTSCSSAFMAHSTSRRSRPSCLACRSCCVSSTPRLPASS